MTQKSRFLIFFLFSSAAWATVYLGQEKPTAAGLHFWTVGGTEGLVERFKTNLYETLDNLSKNKEAFDRFLLAIAEGPLSENQIVEKSALSPSRVEYFISKLSHTRVIRKDGQGRWATTLPIITDKHMKVIRRNVTPMASSTAQIVKKELHQLKTLYGEVRSPLDPSWEEVSHLLIDKFLIDGTFHSAIEKLGRERGGRKLDNHYAHTTQAFFLEQGKSFSSFFLRRSTREPAAFQIAAVLPRESHAQIDCGPPACLVEHTEVRLEGI
jgi:hypothetical protein